MSERMRWISVAGPGPEWQRSAALCDDGTVYLPAAIAGHENMAFLCASWDAAPAVMDSGHVYLTARWLAEKFPEIKEACDLIESRVVAHFAAHGGGVLDNRPILNKDTPDDRA